MNAKRISLRTLLYLEQLYSCSRRALMHRLREMNLVHKSDAASFYQNVRRQAQEHGYGISVYEPGNKDVCIGNYDTLAKELYEAEKISQSHYYSLLADLNINFAQLQTEGEDVER